MMIALHYWNRRWQSVSFDTERGRAKVRWFSHSGSDCHGWAYRYQGDWYAVWSTGANIVFQSGTKSWPMTPAYRCDNQRSGQTRRFALSEAGSLLFELSYPSNAPDDDPTYDDVDLEQDDFFVYVSRLWSDEKWKGDVVKTWAPR